MTVNINEKKHDNNGYKHKCGHYCSSTNEEHCCRCQNPKNGYLFKHKWSICKICWGTMRKHVDGFYFQKCPYCGKTTETTHKGIPVCAPLAGCGCKETREHHPEIDLRIKNKKIKRSEEVYVFCPKCGEEMYEYDGGWMCPYCYYDDSY